MPNLELLKQKIDESPLKLSVIMERAGINNRQTWSNKLSGKTEFTVSELQGLCDALELTKAKDRNAIFFDG